jgi:ABC-type transport system involved in multi-copper enzyme maturation permease subunit
VPATLDGLKEITVIWGAETHRAIRSGRVVVLLGLYSLFSVLVLLIVGAIANAINAQVAARMAETGNSEVATAAIATEMKKGFIGVLAGNDAAMMEALSQVPLVVLVVFKVTLFFLPAYIALMGFDQISGEVGPRSIRYITVRSRRASLLMGKFLVQASLLVGLVLIIDLGIFIYAGLTNPDFTFAALTMNLLKFWLAAIVFSLAYVALTTLCSSLFRLPAVSLIFNIIMLFVFWVMDVIGGALSEKGGKFLRYLSPSYYSGDLLHPQLTEFGISGLAYAAFATVFLGLSYAVLRVRDL